MLKTILQNDIKMPIIVFTEKDMFIDNRNKFLVRKSSLEWFKNNKTIIIDSKGQVFNVNSVELIGRMVWWHFFKNGFYDYYNAYLKVSDIQKISLRELKDKILLFIQENPKYGWSRIATKSEIAHFVENAPSFGELINYFIYFKV